MQIAGFQILAPIAATAQTVVVRARSPEHGPAVLKYPVDEQPTAAVLARWRHEHEVLSGIDSEWVVRPIALLSDGQRPVLVLQEIDGADLGLLLQRQRLALDEKLELALQLCRALGAVHAHGLIHGDLAPKNVLVDAQRLRITLCDFALSTRLEHAGQLGAAARGTPHYMAPEQTGRTHLGVDHRSDLYSLGVLLHELFTGRRPFEQRDPLALLHAQLALPAPALHQVDPTLPPALSAIVDRLLAKQPDDRYQSSYGLLRDLEHCARQWQTLGRIDAFDVGQEDIPEQLRIAQRLYGREPELARLHQALTQARGGAASMLLITGGAGVGKTALVSALHAEVLAHRGHWVRGKCEQYASGQAHAVLTQAFAALLRQLAAEDTPQRRQWGELLAAELRDSAAALLPLLPELGLLLPPTEPPPSLPAAEGEQRLHIAFGRFLRALSAASRPLLLFLDDLHWADAASLRLLESLLGDEDARSCWLIVGTARDEALPQDHLLRRLLAAADAQGGAPMHELKLAPLAREQVGRLLADTLHRPAEELDDLAALCLAKTQGNPFFLSQFLLRLHGLGDLRYVREEGRWEWDLARVQGRAMTDNVIGLMLERLRELPPASQTLLARAALLGGQIDMRALAAVADQDPAEVQAALLPVLQTGLLLELGDTAEAGAQTGAQTGAPIGSPTGARYRFLHDRVQQAAHELTPGEALPALQLQCGRRLLASGSPELPAAHEAMALACLNAARALITEPGELALLLGLNRSAGLRAKAGAAHADAARALRLALHLLPSDAWQTQPQSTLALHLELAESEYLAGGFEAAEALYPLALSHCRQPLGRAAVGLMQAEQMHIQGRFAEAFPLLLSALDEIGLPFPSGEEQAQALFAHEFQEVQGRLSAPGARSILDAPEMHSPEALMAMRLYHALSYASYQTGRFGAFVLDTCRMMRTTLEHGQCDLSSIAFVAHVTAMSAMQRPYADCHAQGELALRLALKRGQTHALITVYQYYSAFYQHWGHPLAEATALVGRGLELGQGGINPLASGFCALLGVVNHFALGTPLEQLERDCEQGLHFLQRSHLPAIVQMLRVGVLQPLRALTGRTATPLSFDSEDFSCAELLSADPPQPGIPLALLAAAALRHAYLMHDAAGWRRMLDLLPMVGLCLPDSPSMVEAGFYAALGRLRESFVDAPDRDQAMAQAREMHQRLQQWAESCATNFLHKAQLLGAELARREGQERLAMDLYARAIESAGAAGFGVVAALANELYAQFWAERQQQQLAHGLVREAYRLFARWGARVRCEQLAQLWPEAQLGRQRPGVDSLGPDSLGSATASESLDRIGSMDLHSLFKAQQLLAQQVHLEALLPQMLEVLLENAGAERGAIVLDEDGELRVEVIGELDARGRLQVQQVGRALDELGDGGAMLLPAALIHATRLSRQPLVLNRPGEDERYAAAPYLRRQRPGSVACLPVLSQGKLVALVYLENRRLAGAFTPRHQQALELLSSQAAVSLANARLYEQLERRVEQRTEELRQMSMRDGLTGVANRRAFDERLAIEWRRSQRSGRPLSLLMLDIDHFKLLNDRLGHLEGDRCISAVAQALQAVGSRGSDLLARYGGEEFALLLPETDAAAADTLARDCLDAVRALALDHPQAAADGRVSVSVGVCTLSAGDVPGMQTLLERADQALYAAKRAGRARWVRWAPPA